MNPATVFVEPTIKKDTELFQIITEVFPKHTIVRDSEIGADCIVTHHSLLSKYKNSLSLTITPLFLRQLKEKNVKLSDLDQNLRLFRNLHMHNKVVYVNKQFMSDFARTIGEIKQMGGRISNSEKPEPDFRLLKRRSTKEGAITTDYVESLYNHQVFIDPEQYYSSKTKSVTKKSADLKKNMHIPYTQTVTHSFTATKVTEASVRPADTSIPTYSQDNRRIAPPSQNMRTLMDEPTLSSPNITDEDQDMSYSPGRSTVYSRPYVVDTSSQRSSVEMYVSAFSKSTRDLLDDNQSNESVEPPKLLSIGTARQKRKRLEPETINELMLYLAQNVKKTKCI